MTHIEKNERIYEAYIDIPFSQHLRNLKKTNGGSEICGTEAEMYGASTHLNTTIQVFSKIEED